VCQTNTSTRNYNSDSDWSATVCCVTRKAETALHKANGQPHFFQQTFMFISLSTFVCSFDVDKMLSLVKGQTNKLYTQRNRPCLHKPELHLFLKTGLLYFLSQYWQYPVENQAKKCCGHKLFSGNVEIYDI
jgi:hypothetical protein